MVAVAGTKEGTCYARYMSRPDRPVLELPAAPDELSVSVDALSVDYAGLELALEPVILESPLDHDEQVEYCVDCDDETKGECVECHEPLCSECGDVCSWCDLQH